jgi:hypothetical protein
MKSFFIYDFLHLTLQNSSIFLSVNCRKSAIPGWGELQKQNSIQLQVFALVFYQLELCGEKSNRNLNNFFFDVAHNFFSVLADIHPQCGIFVWLIAY